MAVRHGYGKVAGADALVFAYDTGDTRNSYKGEPTTNLLPAGVAGVHDSASGNAVTVTDATAEKGPGWKKVTITARGTNFRTLQWTYLSMSSNTLYCHSAVFDWGNMRGKNYFIYFDGNGTGTRAYYRPGDYVNQGSTNINSTMPDGKFAGTITHTASHSHAFFIGNYTLNQTGLNDYFYYKEFQVEVNSHPTQYTGGTRSSTQGLLDLTGNNTLNVTNASFDSSAQVTFDGTSDYITIPHNTVMRNTTSLTVETVFQVYSQFGYYGGIIGKGTSDSDEEYFLGIHPSINKIYFDVGQGTGPYVNATQTVNSNQYYHVVAMHERSGGTSICSIYVNGEFVSNTTSGNTNSVNTNTTDITIGTRWSNGSYSLNGDIPLVKMYNRVLTAAEIKNNYNNYKSRFNL